MNVKDYISSGVLESYVLGVASAAEQQEVEQMTLLHPEIRDEIDAIREALAAHASTFAKTPPPHLKQQIWAKIQQETTTEFKSQNGAKVIELHPSSSKKQNFSWMLAACISLLIITMAMDVYFYSKWKKTEERLAILTSERDQLAQQFEIQQTNMNQVQSELAIAVKPGTRILNLKGVPAFPEALATVFWNDSNKEVYLKVNNLPVPPADKQYQLWAIVNGAPVDAGVFEVNGSFQKMKEFENAQAFAVTLENKGGSPTPTLEAMYVIGNI